jgi:hypothetical protein
MRCASMQPRGFKAYSTGTWWPQRRDTRTRNWTSRPYAMKSPPRSTLGVRAEKSVGWAVARAAVEDVAKVSGAAAMKYAGQEENVTAEHLLTRRPVHHTTRSATCRETPPLVDARLPAGQTENDKSQFASVRARNPRGDTPTSTLPLPTPRSRLLEVAASLTPSPWIPRSPSSSQCPREITGMGAASARQCGRWQNHHDD